MKSRAEGGVRRGGSPPCYLVAGGGNNLPPATKRRGEADAPLADRRSVPASGASRPSTSDKAGASLSALGAAPAPRARAREIKKIKKNYEISKTMLIVS